MRTRSKYRSLTCATSYAMYSLYNKYAPDTFVLPGGVDTSGYSTRQFSRGSRKKKAEKASNLPWNIPSARD